MTQLPNVLRDIIIAYLPDREIPDWIVENVTKLNYHALCRNPAGHYIVETYFSDLLSLNRSDLFHAKAVSADEVHHYLETTEQINWHWISCQPAAINFLEANIKNVEWLSLCRNPAALHLLEANQSKLRDVDWFPLSYNPGVISFLLKHLDKVNLDLFSSNSAAISFLEKNPELIRWYWLSRNENAMYLLEKNQSKISWDGISQNASITIPVNKTAVRELL